MKRTALMILAIVLAASFARAESLLNKEDAGYSLNLYAESGFFGVAHHTIQFGENGTRFDYKEDGNQDVLFPFARYTAALTLFNNHSFYFLYQPLEIVTDAKLKKDTTFQDVTFREGTPVVVTYGFSFYRASYVWYFLKDGFNELGAGLSLQIRNASIRFKAVDGTNLSVNENIGPVPIIKLAGKYGFDNGFWAGFETDGFYASSAIFNGSKYPFEGAIFDTSLRAGLKMKNGLNPYLNLRYLGGGGKGTSRGEDSQGDGYTNNWLHTFSVSLGILID